MNTLTRIRWWVGYQIWRIRLAPNFREWRNDPPPRNYKPRP